MDAATKFFKRILKTDSCWIWLGSKTAAGYGRFYIGNGVIVYAHRYSYELSVAHISSGLHVLHRCDNPSCVRPEHLFIGTHKDNMEDMAKKHRYTLPNTRGELHGSVKLNWDKVRAIRNRKTAGESCVDLANEFGVGPATIWKICRGKLWASA